MRSLDPLVRSQLPRLLPVPGAIVYPLTLYDRVYPAIPAFGGHWTVAAVWIGLLAHAAWSYTVVLAFDAANRPDHFIITGATEIVTRDASPAALSEGIERARIAGPMLTGAQHAFLRPGL